LDAVDTDRVAAGVGRAPGVPAAAGTVVPGVPPGGVPPAAPPTSRRRRSTFPYALVLPSLLLLAALLAYPIYTLVVTSFRQLNLRELIRRDTVWVGLDNYASILGEREFWTVTVRTLVFAAICVALTMIGGTLVALLMRRLGTTLRIVLSVSMLLAWATPVVSVSTIFRWLFDEQYGVVNYLVTALTPLDWDGRAWFDSSISAFAVIILCVVWQAIPFVALTIYAGVTSIPTDVYEAARIDGANAWRQFWNVTGPMLKPIFLILTSLSTIWDLKVFSQVYVITRGGPSGGTVLLNLYTYKLGFGVSRFGLASAAAVVMVAITLVATAWYVRTMIRVGEEEI
jgi:N,N'-diacetylchitobiose transport system permease protein